MIPSPALTPRFGIIELRDTDKSKYPVTYPRLAEAVETEGGALLRNRRWQVQIRLDKPTSQSPMVVIADVFDLSRQMFQSRVPDRRLTFDSGTCEEALSLREFKSIIRAIKAFMQDRLSPLKVVK
ncbi:MAG: hypothetical protein IPK79_03780 [Vampirovibrionales bacterium]|nr:hypothetical protein [Vampirovibrionales bacterium]